MLVGELIAQFEDETTAAEAMMDLDDLKLAADAAQVASENELTVGEFVATTVRHFISHASDTEWVSLFGKLSASQDPGRTFLHHILTAALSPQGGHHMHQGSREIRVGTAP